MLLRRTTAPKPAQPARVFRFGMETYPDPDPSLTPEQVRDLLAANGHPHLTTCAIEIQEETGAKTITFAEKGKALPASAKPGAKQTVNFVPNQGKRG